MQTCFTAIRMLQCGPPLRFWSNLRRLQSQIKQLMYTALALFCGSYSMSTSLLMVILLHALVMSFKKMADQKSTKFKKVMTKMKNSRRELVLVHLHAARLSLNWFVIVGTATQTQDQTSIRLFSSLLKKWVITKAVVLAVMKIAVVLTQRKKRSRKGKALIDP